MGSVRLLLEMEDASGQKWLFTGYMVPFGLKLPKLVTRETLVDMHKRGPVSITEVKIVEDDLT